MTLEEILDLIRQGISDKELRPLIKEFVTGHPEYEEVGVLGSALDQAGLSEPQRAQFRQVYGNVQQSQGSIEEQTPILAAGAMGAAGLAAKAAQPAIKYIAGGPIAGEITGTTGAGAAVGKGIASAVTSITNSHVLSRIGQSMIRFITQHPRVTAGLVGAGALGAVGVNQGIIGGGASGTPGGIPEVPTSRVNITPSEAGGMPPPRRSGQLVEPGMSMPSAPPGIQRDGS